MTKENRILNKEKKYLVVLEEERFFRGGWRFLKSDPQGHHFVRVKLSNPGSNAKLILEDISIEGRNVAVKIGSGYKITYSDSSGPYYSHGGFRRR